MTSKIVLLVLFTSYLKSSAFHYNEIPYKDWWKEAPKYPENCCPLEWVNMTTGQSLPKDWINAGMFMGRDYAYSIGSQLMTALKSAAKDEGPFTFGQQSLNQYPILTNPNQCHLDWYTTKHFQNVPEVNDNIFYPPTGHTKYGAFAQYQGMPGRMGKGGLFDRMLSRSDYDYINIAGVNILYVDCLKSVKSMSTAKLVKITFDQERIDQIRESREKKIIAKKVFTNNSPVASSVLHKFTVSPVNHVELILDQPHENSFVSTTDTYQDWIRGFKVGVNKLLRKFGFDPPLVEPSKGWITSDKSEETQKIFGVYQKQEFEFKQDLNLPATSVVTLTAYSNSVIGKVPFEAIFELTPIKAGDNSITPKILNASLTKYGKQKRIEITTRGTVLITFDGVVDINTGNDVHLDINSTPVSYLSQSEGFPLTLNNTAE